MTKFIYPFCKVDVCQNAISFERLEKKQRVDNEEFSILLFGYNYYVKGVDLAVDAYIKASKVQPDLKLNIIFGDNFEENVRKIKKNYGDIPDGIKILKPVQNISKLYSKHTVYLNASRSEGFSYANMESYYSGLLQIHSDIAANKEQNLPGTIYFSSGNSDELAFAMLEAYKIKDSYSNNPLFVEDNMSIDSWSKKILDIMKL